MYRLVSQGLIPNTPPAYRRLSSRLAQARRDGNFPDLADTLREVHVPPAWPDVSAFVREVPAWFRLDRTRGQSAALYVAAEKDTLRQLLTGWLADLGIPVLAVRSFGSQPSHWTGKHAETAPEQCERRAPVIRRGFPALRLPHPRGSSSFSVPPLAKKRVSAGSRLWAGTTIIFG